jgi:hypothetical protein
MTCFGPRGHCQVGKNGREINGLEWKITGPDCGKLCVGQWLLSCQ